MNRTWRRWIAPLLMGLSLFLGGGEPARAQNAELDQRLSREIEELRARMEKLEKENQQLRQASPPSAPGDKTDATRVSDKEVKSIVDDYLKEKDAEKKKADDAKKQEDEAKKQEAAAQGYVVGSDSKLSASWTNGLQFQSANKDFKLHIGGRFDNDWVFFDQSQALKTPFAIGGAGKPASGGVGVLDDGTFFRRARFKMDGSAWEVMEFALEANFENLNLITFQDFWVGYTGIPILGTVRVGNNRVPQGLEAFTSENYNTFMERAAPFDAFLQNFNPGLFVSNTEFNQHMTWEALFHRIPTSGIAALPFSGTSAGNNANTGADFGTGEYAATGRVTFLPYYENDGREWVHLGANYQFREAKFDTTTGRDVVIFSTRPEIFTGNGLLGNNTKFLTSDRIECNDVQTIGAEAAMVMGPFSIQSEYWLIEVMDASIPPGIGINSSKTKVVPLGDPSFQGWYAEVSYFLTGENRPYDRRFGRFDRVVPFTNFWLLPTEHGVDRGWGAWEIAARYSLVDLNDAATITGTGGALNEYTLGLNWYMNPNMRIQMNYVRVNRNVGAPNVKGDVDEFGMEFHLDF
ncbi:MAG: hypothetical protein JO112_05690 [Planctomycetes bacterium]|nr:hypothetical protein [Planctomycetota bacterium]